MYLYYPSCNFQRLFPDAAKRIRAYMDNQPDVKVMGCCQARGREPEQGDTLITVCMSCMRMLDEKYPDNGEISLFEFLMNREDFPWPDLSGKAFTVQDCFRARGKHGLHEAVRTCLRRCGADVVEMPGNRDEESYDGDFLLHGAYPANIAIAPRYFRDYLPRYVTPVPEEERLAYHQRHAALYRTEHVAGYCNTCVNCARRGGAKAWHLAELLFIPEVLDQP